MPQLTDRRGKRPPRRRGRIYRSSGQRGAVLTLLPANRDGYREHPRHVASTVAGIRPARSVPENLRGWDVERARPITEMYPGGQARAGYATSSIHLGPG